MQMEKKRSPVLSLNAALAQSLDVIDSCKAPVAIFLKGGEIKFVKSTSKLFGKKTEAMIGNLVGVYPPKADARHVREDLAEFYSAPSA